MLVCATRSAGKWDSNLIGNDANLGRKVYNAGLPKLQGVKSGQMICRARQNLGSITRARIF